MTFGATQRAKALDVVSALELTEVWGHRAS